MSIHPSILEWFHPASWVQGLILAAASAWILIPAQTSAQEGMEAQPPDAVVRILVRSNVPLQEAKIVMGETAKMGEVVAHRQENGLYSVYLGSFADSDAARDRMRLLRGTAGLDAEGPRMVSGTPELTEADLGVEAQVAALMGRVDGALVHEDVAEANRLLDQVEAIAPLHPDLPVKRRRVSELEATQRNEQERQQRIVALFAEAREAEQNRKYDDAISALRGIQDLVSQGEQFETASSEIGRLRTLRAQQTLEQVNGGSGGLKGLLLPALGGIAALLLVSAGVFGYLRFRGRGSGAGGPAPPAATSGSGETRLGAGPGGGLPGRSTPPPQPKPSPQKSSGDEEPSQPQGEQPRLVPVTSHSRIRPGTVLSDDEVPVEHESGMELTALPVEAPEGAEAPDQEPEIEEDQYISPPDFQGAGSVAIAGIMDESSAQMEPVQQEELEAQETEEGDSVSLGPTPEIDIGTLVDTGKTGANRQGQRSSSSEIPRNGGASTGILVYSQDFEDERSGTTPKNWQGEYDYATLKVHRGESTENGRKCLRLEKTKGIGSAYYSCRFPEARGRFAAEFDIRCDDKNKYLLGFYIERDRDFRRSIQTVIHRNSPADQPTIRLHEEAIPYKFGEWMHIRLEIDLDHRILDGYANGELVAPAMHLRTCPEAANTLAIRDNAATTGILLIDGIKIYAM